VIIPFVLNVNPCGTLPEATDQLYGGVPPEDCTDVLYGTPVDALGRTDDTIESFDGTLNVTEADALAAGFATLVAVTVAVESDLEPVNNPSLEIVPPSAAQTTPTSLVPLIAALN
jgi:hypothetical protein